ncbi:MAG: S9 family peptidase [Bacteroidota bacterium]
MLRSRLLRSWLSALASGALALLLVPTALAQPADQPANTLTPYLVEMLRSIGEVAVSPDGATVAYTVRTPADPYEANASASTPLFLYDVAAGSHAMALDASVRGLAWTPDGRLSFLYRSEDDSATGLYAMTPGDEAPQVVVAHPTSVRAYDWDATSGRVAFIADEVLEEPENPLPLGGRAPIVYEENRPNRALYVYQPPTRMMPQRVAIEGSVYAVDWHPSGAMLAVSVAPNPYVDASYMYKRIRMLDVASGEVVGRIENPGKLANKLRFSPDGRHLAFQSAQDLGDPSNGRLFVVPVEDASFENAREVFDPMREADVVDYGWLSNNEVWTVVSANFATQTALESHTLDGTATTHIPWDRGLILSDITFAEDGALAFSADTPAHPDELFVRPSGGEAMQATDLNPMLDGIRLARQEVITHEAPDGVTLSGTLFYPLDYEEGRTYPLVLDVHGGPEAFVANGWITDYNSQAQMLAARGYAVFYPNYRGSTGRGVAFAKAGQGDPAGKEFDDLITAADHLIEIGLADPDRVGVTGGSYGGYATAWLSTRYSDRIAAGVMFVGISNKISKVGTTDIADEEFYVHALKRPWDDWQFMLERSPIFYAGQSETPLLILHGEADPRVDAGQSYELYRHLKIRSEAPVRLVLYPGEGHGNARVGARYDYALRALRWFDTFLKGDADALPPAAIEVPAAPMSDAAMEAETGMGEE